MRGTSKLERLLSFVLAVAMVFTMLPISAMAASFAPVSAQVRYGTEETAATETSSTPPEEKKQGEPKVETKEEPKVETKEEPKVETKEEPKVNPDANGNAPGTDANAGGSNSGTDANAGGSNSGTDANAGGSNSGTDANANGSAPGTDANAGGSNSGADANANGSAPGTDANDESAAGNLLGAPQGLSTEGPANLLGDGLDQGETFTVTFMDGETELGVEKVKKGEDADAGKYEPENKEKNVEASSKDVFVGWDSEDYKDVEADATINAEWKTVRKFTVTFVDYEDKTIGEAQSVWEGDNANAPDLDDKYVPAGKKHTGWEDNYKNISKDETVRPVWRELKTFTVIFADFDGRELATQEITEDSAATAPAEPTREGYAFTNWDKEFDKVTSDLTVTAVYRELKNFTLTVTFTYESDGLTAAQPFVAIVQEGEKYAKDVDVPSFPGYTAYDENGGEVSGTVAVGDATNGVNADQTIDIVYKGNPATRYTVEHYQQNITDDDYTIVSDDTETGTGRTGQKTEAAAKDYSGFTAKSFEQKKIEGDGSTVVKIYYDRNTYYIAYDANGGDLMAPVIARFGTPVTEPVPARAGYAFAGWQDGKSVPATVPAENTELIATWTATEGATGYKLAIWLESVEKAGDNYSYTEFGGLTEVASGGTAGQALTEDQVKAAITAPEGFQYKSHDETLLSGDGTTIINVKLERKAYTATFYYGRKSYTEDVRYGASLAGAFANAQSKAGNVMWLVDKGTDDFNYGLNENVRYWSDYPTMPAGPFFTKAAESGAASYKVEYYEDGANGGKKIAGKSSFEFKYNYGKDKGGKHHQHGRPYNDLYRLGAHHRLCPDTEIMECK